MNILDLCYVAVGNCWYLEMNILELQLVLRVFQSKQSQYQNHYILFYDEKVYNLQSHGGILMITYS